MINTNNKKEKEPLTSEWVNLFKKIEGLEVQFVSSGRHEEENAVFFQTTI